jgi:hypothetical protein
VPIEPDEVVQLLARTDTLEDWTLGDPVPGKGEICVEWVDDDTVSDVKVKIGTGFHHYSDLPYWSGGTSGGPGLGNIGSNTVLGNNSASPGAVLELTPSQVIGMLGVVDLTTYLATAAAITGHQALGTRPTITVTATSVNTNPTVTTSGGTTFPPEYVPGTPISGPGIPAHTYIGVRNSATSIGLSSSSTGNAPVNATNASPYGAAGTGTFSIRNVFETVHGMSPALVQQTNALNGGITGYSWPASLAIAALSPDQWQTRWKDGERWVRSYEYDQLNGGITWVKEFPPDIYSPESTITLVPASNPWATPATAQEYLNQARWRGIVPLNGATQAAIKVDATTTAPTGATVFKFKLQYATDLTGATWVDLAQSSPPSAIEVDVNGTGTRDGAYGTIDAAALTVAAANSGKLLIRLLSVITGTVTNTPSWGAIRAWFR